MLSRVARCEATARSMVSCTEAAATRAKPVLRTDMTSEWSPKMESDWQASERAETWNTVGSISPAILCMLGIISSRPCDAVKVVVSEPAVSAPCTAPAAPPSDCISITSTSWPKMFLRPAAAQESANSPMLDEGVMG